MEFIIDLDGGNAEVMVMHIQPIILQTLMQMIETRCILVINYISGWVLVFIIIVLYYH